MNENNSFFSGLFSEHGNWEADEEGEYFIDRNGSLFHIILDRLRGIDVSEQINNLTKLEQILLKSDAEHFMIHSLYDSLGLTGYCEEETEVQDVAKFVSGSRDSCIKVWDVKTGQCLQTLSGSSQGYHGS